MKRRRKASAGVGNERVAFFVPTLEGGGTQKVVALLANAAASLGYDVDLVLNQYVGAFKDRISQQVRVVDLGGWTRYSPLFSLALYMRRYRPRVLYSALNGANLMAVVAKRLASRETKIICAAHNHLGAKLSRGSSLNRVARESVIGWAFRRADRCVAVSESIRTYLQEELGVAGRKLSVLPNPIDFREVDAALAHPIEYSKLPHYDGPLIVASGRLCSQKDYSSMLKAFRRLTEARPANLVALGEGELRVELERQIEAMGLGGRVHLVGFQSEPLRWMARADVFLTTSRWEGSPLVLLEAIALGLRIVATDCPSGPAEILADYPWGRLVPVGDEKAICDALLEATNAPGESRSGARADFRAARSATSIVKRYLDLA